MSKTPTTTKSRFVNVPAEAITNLLDEKGFVKDVSGREIVYYMRHKKNPKLILKIYTSLPVDAKKARACGKDAIRCVGIFEGSKQTYGLYKGPRTYRTGTVEGVLDRMLKNARDAYGFLTTKVQQYS